MSILKKGIVIRKISRNELEIKDEVCENWLVNFPKKFLINYIKIDLEDPIYFVITSTSNKLGRVIFPHEFIHDADLSLQKKNIDKTG